MIYRDFLGIEPPQNATGITLKQKTPMAWTHKEKRICLTLLRNRRKSDYGKLDGNPLSLRHLQALDDSISQADIDALCEKGILKPETCSYRILATQGRDLTEHERLVMEHAEDGRLVPDDFGSSLADLYDPLTMPPELVKAHARLDALVDRAYGLSPSCTDSERVAHLFALYAEKAEKWRQPTFGRPAKPRSRSASVGM